MLKKVTPFLTTNLFLTPSFRTSLSIIVCIGILFSGSDLINIEKDRVQFQMQRELDNVRQKIEGKLYYLTSMAQVLGSVEMGNNIPHNLTFNQMIQRVVKGSSYISRIVLTNNDTVTHVYHRGEMTQMIGKPYITTEAGLISVNQLKKTKQPILMGPFQHKNILSQTITLLVPIYHIHNNDSYYGLVGIEIDFNDFSQQVGLSNPSDMTIALMKKDKSSLYGDQSVFWTVGHAVQLLNANGIQFYIGGTIKNTESNNLLFFLKFFTVFLAFIIPLLLFFLLRSYGKVRHQSMHDPLTSLPNLRHFHSDVQNVISNSKRTGSSFTILFIDINKFKQINDSLGHKAGDIVLQTVAERLRKNLRQSDIVSRIGGDEFVIMLKGVAEKSLVNMIVKKLKQSAIKPIHFEKTQLNISLSIGYSFYPQEGETSSELIKQADNKMYEDKQDCQIKFNNNE